MSCLKIRLKTLTISRRKSSSQEIEDHFHNAPPSKPLFEFQDAQNAVSSSLLYRLKKASGKLDQSFLRLLVGPSFFLSSYTVWHHFPRFLTFFHSLHDVTVPARSLFSHCFQMLCTTELFCQPVWLFQCWLHECLPVYLVQPAFFSRPLPYVRLLTLKPTLPLVGSALSFLFRVLYQPPLLSFLNILRALRRSF